MSDPVYAILLLLAFLAALAVVRFFKTLDPELWLAAATPVLAGLVSGLLLRFLPAAHPAAIGIVLTISRAGIPIFALVTLGATVVCMTWRITIKKVLGTATVLVGVGVLLAVAGQDLIERFTDTSLKDETDESKFENRGQYFGLAKVIPSTSSASQIASANTQTLSGEDFVLDHAEVSAVERLAAAVAEPYAAQGMAGITIGSPEGNFLRADFALQNRHHRRLVFADRYAVFEFVLEKIPELLAFCGCRSARLHQAIEIATCNPRLQHRQGLEVSAVQRRFEHPLPWYASKNSASWFRRRRLRPCELGVSEATAGTQITRAAG